MFPTQLELIPWFDLFSPLETGQTREANKTK